MVGASLRAAGPAEAEGAAGRPATRSAAEMARIPETVTGATTAVIVAFVVLTSVRMSAIVATAAAAAAAASVTIIAALVADIARVVA